MTNSIENPKTGLILSAFELEPLEMLLAVRGIPVLYTDEYIEKDFLDQINSQAIQGLIVHNIILDDLGTLLEVMQSGVKLLVLPSSSGISELDKMYQELINSGAKTASRFSDIESLLDIYLSLFE